MLTMSAPRCSLRTSKMQSSGMAWGTPGADSSRAVSALSPTERCKRSEVDQTGCPQPAIMPCLWEPLATSDTAAFSIGPESRFRVAIGDFLRPALSAVTSKCCDVATSALSYLRSRLF
jgi:hypothetical protein